MCRTGLGVMLDIIETPQTLTDEEIEEILAELRTDVPLTGPRSMKNEQPQDTEED